MQYPIPQDWDGESWRRFAICWPDSPFWISYLNGFVTYFTRGRSWDGKTGNIKAAQLVGWEIANNNLPLEEVLLSCSEGQWIAKAIIMHAAVTGGFEVTIPTEITDDFFAVTDFAAIGLANRLGPIGPSDGPQTIQATLANLQTSLEALTTALAETGATGEDLEDDLANIWQKLEDITTILGGSISDPPTPL